MSHLARKEFNLGADHLILKGMMGDLEKKTSCNPRRKEKEFFKKCTQRNYFQKRVKISYSAL